MNWLSFALIPDGTAHDTHMFPPYKNEYSPQRFVAYHSTVALIGGTLSGPNRPLSTVFISMIIFFALNYKFDDMKSDTVVSLSSYNADHD